MTPITQMRLTQQDKERIATIRKYMPSKAKTNTAAVQLALEQMCTWIETAIQKRDT